MQDNNYCTFKIYTHYLTWDIARILWIGFYQNSENKDCFIYTLPKDLVKFILSMIGSAHNITESNCIFV